MMPSLPRAALALLLLALAVAVLPTVEPIRAQTAPPLPAHGLRLPATFTGRLPCADCAGLEVRLDLWPDQVFELQRTWLGKEPSRAEAGRWRIDAARGILVLHGSAEMPLRLEVKGPERLRALDLAGQAIEPAAAELRSDGALAPPVALRLPMGGDVVVQGDAVGFTDCLTGRRFAVAAEGARDRLLQAHSDAGRAAGRPLYVTLEGTLTPRGGERVLVVDRFVNAWPQQTCERARAPAALENTYWRLVRLGGVPLAAVAGRREPHLILRAVDGQRRYAATVGCNQMVGGYTLDGGALRFTAGASTLMACPDPLGEREKALQAALAETRAWRITANTLEVGDSAGRPLALFEAVYF